MQMLYNSDQYAVVQIGEPEADSTGAPEHGGYEVVDKFVLSPFKGLVDEVARFFAPIIYAISVRWRALMERIDRMFNRKRA